MSFWRTLLFGHRPVASAQLVQRRQSLDRLHGDLTRRVREASQRQIETSLAIRQVATASSEKSMATREVVRGVLEAMAGGPGLLGNIDVDVLERPPQVAKADLLAEVIDSALDAVITIDLDGLVIEWSSAAEAMFGFSKTEAIGQVVDHLIIPDDLVAAHRLGMSHYRKTGEGPVLRTRIKIDAIDRDRERFKVELTISDVHVKGNTFFTARIRRLDEDAET